MFLTRLDIVLILGQGAIVMVSSVLMVLALVRSARTSLWQSAAIAGPIIAGAIGVYFVGGIGSALTLLAGASVCAMLFCNGAAMLLAQSKETDPPAAGALASLVFPIGMVLLISGFAAYSTTAGLVGLAIVGVLAMDIIRGETGLPSIPLPNAGISMRVLAWVVGAAAAGVLAFTALSMLRGLERGLPLVGTDAFVILFICPAVTLPLLVHATRAAATANLPAATGLIAAVTCLLLGLVLPTFIVVDYALTARLDELARPAGLPPISWRLDSPLLVMAGFGMLGMRMGFLKADRWVALLFVLIYGLYILTGTLMRTG